LVAAARERLGLEPARDEEIRSQRERLARGREVGEGAVDATLPQLWLRHPASVLELLGVQMLEALEVAADDDQVHPALVLEIEVAHGGAGAIDDPKAVGRARAGVVSGAFWNQAVAVPRDGEPRQRRCGRGCACVSVHLRFLPVRVCVLVDARIDLGPG
jgi:hypothetical protein